jgi:hypothetical protein
MTNGYRTFAGKVPLHKPLERLAQIRGDQTESLEKYGAKVWSKLSWLRSVTNGGHLRTVMNTEFP